MKAGSCLLLPARRAPGPPWCAAALTAAIGVAPAAGAASIGTLADELPIEQLGHIPVESVSTASRFTQTVSEAPASVTVVEGEDFRRFGYRTLADALDGVRGLHVTGDRTYSYLGVRGFSQGGDYNSRVLVLVDGHRVNDNVFESAYIGREFILDVDDIERIEIVRGPSSSLYGSSAFFGVVNVITRRHAAGEAGSGSVAAEAGSFDSWGGHFAYGGPLGTSGVRFDLSGAFHDSAGQPDLYYPEFDTPGQNRGHAEYRDAERALNLRSVLAWSELTLTAAWVSREKDVPSASWDTLFNDPRYRTTDAHGYVDLALDHAFSEDTELSGRVYFDDVRYQADYPIRPVVSGVDAGLNQDGATGQLAGFETHVTHQWGRHTFMVGTELREHVGQDLFNRDPLPEVTFADVREQAFDAGAFVQDEVTLLEPLRFSAGVRYDYYDSFGSTVSPRLGLIYTPWQPTTFKLLYGTAYRAPNAYELHFPLGDLPTNTTLDPERIQTVELVWEQYLGREFRCSVAGYHYHLEDLITVDPATLLFGNTGTVDASGVEGEIEWRHASGVRVRASYAVQRAENSDTGDRLSNSPEHLAKFAALFPFFDDRLSAGLEVRHASRAATLPGRVTPWTEGYWIANLTLFSQKLIRGVEISGSLYNLLDEHYAFPGGPGHVQDTLAQDGRTWRVKLTCRF